MPGTARKLMIVILSVLLVVLVIVAVIIFLNSRNNRVQQIVNGAVCTPGSAGQCEGSSTAGNTGQLCTCDLGGDGTSRWNCATRDLTRCPLPTGSKCQPGETQTGQCGSNSCLGTQRPIQTCGADGNFGAASCVTDVVCDDGANSSSPILNCQVSGDNKTLSITDNCPTDFSYLVKLHVTEAPETATSDADCRTAFDNNAQIINAKPGDSLAIDIADYTCGKCVRYELTQTPTSAFIKASSAYAFTGVCGGEASSSSSQPTQTVTSTPTSSTVSSATSSISGGSLPDTGLFDDPQNYPLLVGIGLILLGLGFNRIGKLKFGPNYETVVERRVR